MRMDQHIKRLIEKYTVEASRLSDYEALERYSMAYTQARELGNAFTLRACAANLGAMLVSLGKKEEAGKGIAYLKEAIPPAGTVDCASNGDVYFNMGLGYEVLGRYRDAGAHFQEALRGYKGERDNLPMEVDTLKRLVQNSLVRRRDEDVVRWYKDLEETYARANKQTDQLLVMVQRITRQQQLTHGQRNAAPKAEAQEGGMVGEEGEDDEEEGKDTDQESEGSAQTVESAQQIEIARDLDRCCDILQTVRRQGKDSEVMGTRTSQFLAEVGLLVQVSVLLTHFKKLDRARQLLQEALSLFEDEDGESVEQAVVLQNLGTVCNYLGHWEAGLPHHRRAAAIYLHYASLPQDARSPIQPRAAQRCQGHCLAGHAYALVNLDDVDEARVLFDKARDLADRSGDFDTKWQMDEALGAVHFRMACQDFELSAPLSADTKVVLPESCLEHLSKSMRWYKKALKDLADAPRGSQVVLDRVLEKFTQVQIFRKNASKAPAGLYVNPAAPPAVEESAVVVDTAVPALSVAAGGAESSSSGEEEDDEEDSSSEEEEDSNGESDRGNGAGLRTLTGEHSPQRVRFGKTPKTPADEDDDKTRMEALYQAQLGTDTLEGSGVQKTVQADIHQQMQRREKHHSSSAESGSTGSRDSTSTSGSGSSSEDEEEEEEEGRGLPPVPTQSPPVTLLPSGTYEKASGIDDLYGSPKSSASRPRPPVGSTDYAELDFGSKRPSAAGELDTRGGGRREGEGGPLNYFVNSSEGEDTESTKRSKSAAASSSQDPDYEPVEVRPSTRGSQRGDQQVDFEMGGNYLSQRQDKEKVKDSKTCVVM